MRVLKYLFVCGLAMCLVACDAADDDSASADALSPVEADAGADESLTEDTVEASDDAGVARDMSDATAAEDTGTEEDTASAPEDEPPAVTMMTVRLINAGTGGGYAGVTVSAGEAQETTDTSGQASVPVPAGPYHVVLSAGDARAHHVYGVADEDAFTQISYMSPDSVTMGVFGSLSIQDDPTRGTLVVGLDQPSLAPAVGASAAIDLASDPAFIFSGFLPTPGATIVAGGQSFVTFPNVEAGTVQVSATMPEGACLPFPALGGELDIEIHPGEVSVVAFICE